VADDLIAFSMLDAAQISALEALGARRRVEPGDLLYREGDATYDFFVVLSGEVEIVTGIGNDEKVVARHGPGRFLGELNLLTGLRVFVTARVTQPGQVLAVHAAQLRHVIDTQPGLSDVILAGFIARRTELMSGASTSIRVIGSRFSPETGSIREFLFRSRIPHAWLDPEHDSDVEALLREFAVEPSELPVVIATGSVLRRPTVGVLAEYLGITVANLPDRCFDLVVVGGGPAGLAAAVYGASEGLTTLGLEATAVGGQAGSSSRIENYLGFPTGISGGDLTQRAVVQAEKFGAALTSPCAATGLPRARRSPHRPIGRRHRCRRTSGHRCERRALSATRRGRSRGVRVQGRLLRGHRGRGSSVHTCSGDRRRWRQLRRPSGALPRRGGQSGHDRDPAR